MKKKELLYYSKGEIKITMNGIQYMQDHYKELSAFVKEVEGKINIIDVCSSIAREEINKGDTVYLFMENGSISAYKSRRSTSSGVSATTSKKGEVAIIENLRGLLKFDYGDIYIVRTDYRDPVKIKSLQNIIRKKGIDIIAVEGIEAQFIAERYGMPVTIKYGGSNAVIDCAIKGQIVLFLVSNLNYTETIKELKSAMENYNFLTLKMMDFSDLLHMVK